MKKLSKDDFLKIHDEGNFISGIHNYCDRWCERCPKTQFCSVFATDKYFQEATGEETEDKNLGNSLEIVSNMFEITLEMISDMTQKNNVVISEEDLKTAEIEIKKERHFTDKHPLNQLGTDYFKLTDEILETNTIFFKEEIEKQALLFVEEKKKELLSLKDSFEIIRWYCTMIPAKLHRACGNLYDKAEMEEEWMRDEFFGTFKVALISTKRSMVAWAKLLEFFPEKEDEILPALVMLEKIYKYILEFCPTIESYKRIGFED